VLASDSFSFWYRAQSQDFRESLEVWISTVSPRIPDFVQLDAFGTSSISYERRAYDLLPYEGHRVFLGLVYRSLNQYGLMIDDVSGPEKWNPIHDVGISRTSAPRRFQRLGAVVRPSCWGHNWAQASEWVRVSCEIIGVWREETGVELTPGDSALVLFPEIAFWQPGTLEVVFATLLGHDQRYWNDSAAIDAAVYPFQSRGGPDSLGYVWYDSDDPLGPEYDWLELYPSGTLLGWGDDSLILLNLEWPFRFYSREYSMLFVCTNGWFAFGPPSPGNPADSNVAIPNRYNPNRLIAPFWDDLWVKGNEGGIWYDYFGDSLLVIEWRKTRRKGCDKCSLNFEAKLFRDGTIEFHYMGVDAGDERYDAGMSGTVGIENPTGRVGLEYLHNGFPPGNLLSPGRAIRFEPRPPGIMERAEDGRLKDERRIVTIVRNVLFLPEACNVGRGVPVVLLDISGRRVMELESGDNDVRHLASGVYFVRLVSGVGRGASGVRKVIIQR
jgi:hypothetical protein